MNTNKPTIHIILNQPYPVGMACTNRIHLYARGLISQGCRVKIILPTPLERPGQIHNHVCQGTYEEINFQHAWKTPVRSCSFFKRRFHDIFSPLIAGWISFKNRPVSILLVSTHTYHIVIFKIVTILLNIPFYKEQSELPFFSKKSLNLIQKIYIHTIYQLFDGLIVISDNLMHFFQPRLKKDATLLKIPIQVDVAQIFNPTIKRKKHIIYTGPLTQQKDGILTIITSFINIADEFPDYQLKMTGDLSISSDQERILSIIKNSSVQDRIHFLGFVDRPELVKILNQAAILLLAKPPTRQNSACFPTKLGEYLATGNPVLTTNIGEVDTFLNDNTSSFLSAPDVKSFTARLKFILSDMNNARRVGRRGQILADNEFNYMTQAKYLANFLLSNSIKG